MNQFEDQSFGNLRSINFHHLAHERGLSTYQEGKLLGYALLITSVIEKLTTSKEDQGSFTQKDKKHFLELIDWMEELEKADNYLSQDKYQFILQPEWIEFMDTVRKEENFDFGPPIDNALVFLKRIVADQEITIENPQQIDFVNLLRKLLNGIMVKLSQ